MKTLLGLGLLAACAAGTVAMADEYVLDHEVETLSGEPFDLKKFDGRVVLVVNVASRCGMTPQYEPLQALYEKYKDQGLVVAGFPCNQFGGQEPGTPEQIREFCTANYDVTFPLFAKVDVNGSGAAPLYQELTSPAVTDDPGRVKWNFEKFLIGRDGKVIARFRTRVAPDSPEVVEAIEAALAS